MTKNQEQFISLIMQADNATIVSMCNEIYYHKYDQETGKYLALTFNDETVLEEFRFRNAIRFEETTIPEQDPRTTATYLQMIYDCEKFNDIRDRMNKLIGELKAVEDSTDDWFLKLNFQVETLRNFLEAWTANTAELSVDCQSLAREFKAKL